MGLEIFVLAMCIKTTAEGCEHAGTAYYTQSGIQKSVESKQYYYYKRYPVLSPVIAATGLAFQDRAVLSIGNGRYLTMDKKANILGIKQEF